MSDLPFVQARWFYTGRRRPVRLLVMHTPQGPETDNYAENLAAYFSTTDVTASVHVVGDNNSAIQCVRDEDTAFGAENANADGWHYELAGVAEQDDAEWADAYSQAALRIAAPIFRDAATKFAIPLVKLAPTEIATGAAGVCGHADVYQALGGQAYRSDPGAAFPWDQFMDLLKGDDMPTVDEIVQGVATYLNGQRADYNAAGVVNLRDLLNQLSGAFPGEGVPNTAEVLAKLDAGGGASGLSEADVRRIVAEELAKKEWR